MTSPIFFKDILPGDVIRAEWTYNLSGTKVTMEGEVAAIYPKENLLHIMTYVKGGIGGWEISEHSNVFSSKATFYLIKRKNKEEEESKGFSYEILGKYTGPKGTVIDKMRPCILEKRIKKLFILPQDLSPNETTCTS